MHGFSTFDAISSLVVRLGRLVRWIRLKGFDVGFVTEIYGGSNLNSNVCDA